jgi:hypothetical protein
MHFNCRYNHVMAPKDLNVYTVCGPWRVYYKRKLYLYNATAKRTFLCPFTYYNVFKDVRA